MSRSPGSVGPPPDTLTAVAASIPVIAPPSLEVTCWGTRGSIPSPGATTVRYGGNTSCLEVRLPGGRRYVFDAGTGIRGLGRRLAEEEGPITADVFLTHFHWDHIQGMPFFAPLHDPRTRLRIHAAQQGEMGVRELFTAQMSPTFFPVPFEALGATLEFVQHDGRVWVDEGVEVAAMRVRHPANTFAYRLRYGGLKVAYVPDNELIGGDHPAEPGWYPRFVEFLSGADVLFHDAMYTEEEYPSREGWGHSTFAQAARLAEEAGVRSLYFFHHAPERGDAELDRLLEAEREASRRRGGTVELHIAEEGATIHVKEREP
jgi:phosphoribosyl 1,2-cyclic phosphodiesterase